jgi:hypothetical protein
MSAEFEAGLVGVLLWITLVLVNQVLDPYRASNHAIQLTYLLNMVITGVMVALRYQEHSWVSIGQHLGQFNEPIHRFGSKPLFSLNQMNKYGAHNSTGEGS